MHPVIAFVLGFGAFPLAFLVAVRIFRGKEGVKFTVLLFVMSFVGRREKVTVDTLSDGSQTQEILKRLYQEKGHDQLFLVDKESALELRILRKEYKSTESSIEVQIRFNDKTRRLHGQLKEVTEKLGVEYRERNSATKRLPSRIMVNFKSSGVWAIPLIAQYIQDICMTANPESKYQPRVSFSSPMDWKRDLREDRTGKKST